MDELNSGYNTVKLVNQKWERKVEEKEGKGEGIREIAK